MMDLQVDVAKKSDAAEILAMQKEAYMSEAAIYNDYLIPPLTQSLTELECDLVENTFYIVRIKNKIVGGVTIKVDGEMGYIGRLMVSPEHQGKGLGGYLLFYAENATLGVRKFELFTGHKSDLNLIMYRKRGYKDVRREKIHDGLELVYLVKDVVA